MVFKNYMRGSYVDIVTMKILGNTAQLGETQRMYWIKFKRLFDIDLCFTYRLVNNNYDFFTK